MQYIVAHVEIRGEALPLAKLNFVKRVTPIRRQVVFGATLHNAQRMTYDEAREVVNRCVMQDMLIHPVREG